MFEVANAKQDFLNWESQPSQNQTTYLLIVKYNRHFFSDMLVEVLAPGSVKQQYMNFVVCTSSG